MSAVQAILEHVTAEFSAADTGDGRWAGVDADSRLRLARRIRDEVNRLTEVFERVRSNILSVPGGDLTPDDLENALNLERRELQRLTATRASLEDMLRRLSG